DAATRREVGTLEAARAGAAGAFGAAAFAPDGSLLAAGGAGRSVKVWDLSTRRLMTTLPGSSDGARALAFAPDGQALACAGEDRAVRLWEVGPWKGGAATAPLPQAVTSLVYSPDGQRLAAAAGEGGHAAAGTITLFDAGTLRPQAVLKGHARAIG